MKRHKYALGLWEMLAHALFEHYRQYQGLPPKRFELHPANCDELRSDERMKYMAAYFEKREFMGVPIIVDVLARRPKMITADNKVEYL